MAPLGEGYIIQGSQAPHCPRRIKQGGCRGCGWLQPVPAGAQPAPQPGPPGHASLLALKPGCCARDARCASCLLMIPKLRNANLFRADSFSKGNLPQLLIPRVASIQTPRKHLQLFLFFLSLSPFFPGRGGGDGGVIENLCFLWCDETCFALLPPFLSPFNRINTADPAPAPPHVPEE